MDKAEFERALDDLNEFVEWTEKQTKPYEVKLGLDGQWYAVFCCETHLTDYEIEHPEHFKGCSSHGFNAYMNAFLLGTIH